MVQGGKNKKSGERRAARWLHAVTAQPPHGFYARPELHIVCGGLLQLDGCKRLTRFDDAAICAETAGWLITLYGDGLRIESLCGKRLLLSGVLLRAEFSPAEPRAGAAK